MHLQVTDGSTASMSTSERAWEAMKKVVNEEFADVEGQGHVSGCSQMFAFACADALECNKNESEGVTELKTQVCCSPWMGILLLLDCTIHICWM